MSPALQKTWVNSVLSYTVYSQYSQCCPSSPVYYSFTIYYSYSSLVYKFTISLSIPWYRVRVFASVEVHHQLFSFPCIDLKVVPLRPIHKALEKSKFSQCSQPSPGERGIYRKYSRWKPNCSMSTDRLTRRQTWTRISLFRVIATENRITEILHPVTMRSLCQSVVKFP